MKAAAASRSAVRHSGEHGQAELLDFDPFGTAFDTQETEGHGLDQRQAPHLVAEPARRFERHGGAVGMTDEMHLLLRLFGELEQHGKIGLAGEDLAVRPGVGLPIADEVRGEHAPFGERPRSEAAIPCARRSCNGR
jgi:hypothetical protein